MPRQNTSWIGVGMAIGAASATLYAGKGLRVLKKRHAQLVTLSNVFARITEDLSLDSVAEATLKETLRFMRADMATLRRREENKLVAVGALATDGRAVSVSDEVLVGEGLTGRVATSGETLRLNRDAESRMAPGSDVTHSRPSDQLNLPRYESGMIVPLIVGSELVGTLACWSHRKNAFTAEDERALNMLGTLVATALLAAVTMAETIRKASMDPLTELPGRSQLKTDLRTRFGDRVGEAGTCIIAMADIDNLKQFNEEFGYSAGDEAIKRVARVLRDDSQAPDFVYRFGGAAFLMVYLDVSAEEAVEKLEHLRNAVLESAEPARRLSISIGVADSQSVDYDTPLADLVECADEALLQAKSSGLSILTWNQSKESAA